MSAALMYSPGASDREYQLYFELKYRLAPVLWNQDGSMSADRTTLDKSKLVMLAHIVRVTKAGPIHNAALRLMRSIRKHGYVTVWLER